VPKTQLSALSQLSKTPSINLSSLDSSEDSSNNDNPEPRRSGRVKRPTCNAKSQASQDRAAAALAAASSKVKSKGRKVRKAKLMNTSQLLDEFTLE